MTELIKELSMEFGPSGLEERVSNIIYNKLSTICDTVEITPMGAVVGVIKGGNGKSKMVSCALDETTFVVSDIDSEGFIKVKAITNYDSRAISGKRIVVGNEDITIEGIITSKVLHLSSGEERSRPSLDKMFIDIGFNKGEDIKGKIEIGDYVTFKGDFRKFGKDKLVGKALDSRANCAIAIKAAENIKKSGKIPSGDIVFAFNAKEKAGKTTAVSITNKYGPSQALILSCCSADATKDDKQSDCCLGAGAVIVPLDHNTLYFGSSNFQSVIKAAEKNNIKIQIPSIIPISNPSAHLERSGVGVSVLNISLPCLNIRSDNEIISTADINAVLEITEMYLCDKI